MRGFYRASRIVRYAMRPRNQTDFRSHRPLRSGVCLDEKIRERHGKFIVRDRCASCIPIYPAHPGWHVLFPSAGIEDHDLMRNGQTFLLSEMPVKHVTTHVQYSRPRSDVIHSEKNLPLLVPKKASADLQMRWCQYRSLPNQARRELPRTLAKTRPCALRARDALMHSSQPPLFHCASLTGHVPGDSQRS